MKESLNIQETKDMFLMIAEKIMEAEDKLTEIDNIIGDGDHGIGMRIGFQAVKEKLPQTDCSSINEVFKEAGLILLEAMGGASGVIFGTMFTSGAINAARADTLSVAVLADIFSQSLEKIKTRGGARVGDKTMVDSFEPAVLSLLKSAQEDKNLTEAMEAAYEKAIEGVEESKKIRANRGRAQAYAEASVGLPDPGAVSVSVIFEAMRLYMEA